MEFLWLRSRGHKVQSIYYDSLYLVINDLVYNGRLGIMHSKTVSKLGPTKWWRRESAQVKRSRLRRAWKQVTIYLIVGAIAYYVSS